jgi:predicted dithiol-disulfide oxidoreductase (DUF899 family)
MTTTPKIVSHEEWMTARQTLLAKEKEFTRLRDELSQARRALPWEEVTKEYQFEGPHGIVTHLNQRDVTMIAVSRAPYARLEAYQKRLC